MIYKILGVLIQRDYHNNPGWEFYVAWQSNLPEYSFSWRVTMTTMDRFPIEDDIQRVAARGDSVYDKKIVRKLFPYLDVKSLTY